MIGYLNDIMYKFRGFYEDEFEMLKYLANNNIKEFKELAESDPKLIDHIVGYGFVQQIGDDFDFVFSEIRDILLKEDSSFAETREDIYAEITASRSILERAMRTELTYWRRNLDDEKFFSVFDGCITNSRKEKLRNCGSEIFHAGKSPLMLLELMKFYKEAFSMRDEIHRISELINSINKKRVDAHSKDISIDEYLEFRKEFDEISAYVILPD